MGDVDARLRSLGITLPASRAPLANYVPAVRVGNLVYTAGQVSAAPDREFKGKVGAELSLEDGREAARVCVVNCLTALLTVIDSLDQVVRIVQVSGFINSAPGFEQQPAVLNGASDLLAEVFGDAGKHSRRAVGGSELPAGFAVEVDLIAAVADA